MQVVELRDCCTSLTSISPTRLTRTANPEPFFADKTLLPVFDAFIIMYSVHSFSSYMKAGTLYERLQKQLTGTELL